MCVCFDDFFFIWVLCLFQEYFTYIELIVHQRWAKTGVPGEKTTWPSVSRTRLSHMWRDPSETRTTAVRNDEILVSVYLINILYACVCAVLGPRGWQNMELSWIHGITESSEKSTEMSVVLDYSHPNGPKPCTWS